MNVALILSGGRGRRMSLDVPKQYIPVKGRPVLLYSLKTLVANEKIDAVQIVAGMDCGMDGERGAVFGLGKRGLFSG